MAEEPDSKRSEPERTARQSALGSDNAKIAVASRDAQIGDKIWITLISRKAVEALGSLVVLGVAGFACWRCIGRTISDEHECHLEPTPEPPTFTAGACNRVADGACTAGAKGTISIVGSCYHQLPNGTWTATSPGGQTLWSGEIGPLGKEGPWDVASEVEGKRDLQRYSGGAADGRWRQWRRRGGRIIEEEAVYSLGEPISFEVHSDDHQIFRRGSFTKGKRSGEWIEQCRNVIFRTIFDDGKIKTISLGRPDAESVIVSPATKDQLRPFANEYEGCIQGINLGPQRTASPPG